MMFEKYYYNDTKGTYNDYDGLVRIAREKIYPLTEEKFEGFIIGLGYTPVTKGAAKEFYRDLCGTLYGNANINCRGTMSAKGIADVMGITESKAYAFLYTCAEYGITERQGGAWVC